MALHRPAEFNKSHIPAFLADEEPRAHICVYPFVRSYEWYLLDDAERRRMLAQHGQQARGYADVRANTVASFALGDYEWILAFEADELHRIVDLMRDLRASDARRHVREEVPFYTGARVRPGGPRRPPALTCHPRTATRVARWRNLPVKQCRVSHSTLFLGVSMTATFPSPTPVRQRPSSRTAVRPSRTTSARTTRSARSTSPSPSARGCGSSTARTPTSG